MTNTQLESNNKTDQMIQECQEEEEELLDTETELERSPVVLKQAQPIYLADSSRYENLTLHCLSLHTHEFPNLKHLTIQSLRAVTIHGESYNLDAFLSVLDIYAPNLQSLHVERWLFSDANYLEVTIDHMLHLESLVLLVNTSSSPWEFDEKTNERIFELGEDEGVDWDRLCFEGSTEDKEDENMSRELQCPKYGIITVEDCPKLQTCHLGFVGCPDNGTETRKGEVILRRLPECHTVDMLLFTAERGDMRPIPYDVYMEDLPKIQTYNVDDWSLGPVTMDGTTNTKVVNECVAKARRIRQKKIESGIYDESDFF